MSKRGTILRCSYIVCRKTSVNKRSFGQSRALAGHQLSSYSTWLKPIHDGVVSDLHRIALRRQLAKQQHERSVARMAQLLAAPAVVDSAVLVSPTTSGSNFVSPSRTCITRLGSTGSTRPIRRSMPLLRANARLCDARQRRRIEFTCVMTGVTWTTAQSTRSQSHQPFTQQAATWYSLTQHVWETIEAVKADCETTYAQQLVAAGQGSDRDVWSGRQWKERHGVPNKRQRWQW